VELVDLDYVMLFKDNQSHLKEHRLLSHKDIGSLDDFVLIKARDNVECHSPFLLAWMILRYCSEPELEKFEVLALIQSLILRDIFRNEQV